MPTHRNVLMLLPLLLPLTLSTTGCGYNQIQTLDERTQQTKQQIQVQLQRRSDLIPNLVNTVKGYAAQEVTVFTNVANARAQLAGAIQRGDPREMAQANDQLTGALGRLLAISEAYPQLKSNENFLRLQDELTGTENRIAVSRSDYNDAVNQYNSFIRRFPQALTAKVIGAQPRTYFEASATAQTAPTVDFSQPAVPAGGTPAGGTPAGAAPSSPAPAASRAP